MFKYPGLYVYGMNNDFLFLAIIILAIPIAIFLLYTHVAYVKDKLKTRHYDKFFLVAFALFMTFVLGIKSEFLQGTFIVVWAVLSMTFYIVNLLARSLFYDDMKKILKKI